MGKIRGRKPKGGQRIKEPDPSVSTDQQTPVFCLHHLQGKYCLSACDRDERAAFADTLHKLSQSSWAELSQLNRHKKGYEHISRDSIRVGVFPSIATPDVSLIAFRFSGMKPMVGFRNRSTFHVLWLDNDFTLYDHG